MFKEILSVIGLTKQFVAAVAVAAGHVTTHYNLPQVSWMSNALVLGNKTLFRTFVRTSGLLSQAGYAAVTIQKQLGWRKSGLLYGNRGIDLRCSLNSIKAFKKENLMMDILICLVCSDSKKLY